MRQIRSTWIPGARAGARRARSRSSSPSSIRRSCRCPEITDLLLIWMVTQHKSRMVAVRRERDARLDRRLPGAVLPRPQGRRRARPQALQQRDRVDRAMRRVPALRRDGGADSVAAAAAGAVQDLRAAGRRRRDQRRRASSLAIAIGRGIRYFGEGLLAVWYGDRAIDVHPRATGGRCVALSLVGGSLVAAARRATSLGREGAGARRNAIIELPT